MSANDQSQPHRILVVNEEEAATSQAYTRKPYPGQMRIHCKGQIVTSGKNAWFIYTVGGIALLFGFFLYYLASAISQRLSLSLVIADIALFMIAISMAFTTAWSDPGIIPRRLCPRETLRINGATDFGVDGTISRLVFHDQNPDFLLGKEVLVEGERTFLKYCSTCEIFRPPKASHCSFCDNCVEDFDHHCPWLSNCIGRRNYRYFLTLLISISITCIAISVQSGFILWDSKIGFKDIVVKSFSQNWHIVIFGAFVFLTGLLLAFLTMYHFVLVSKDLTTSEQVKQTRAAAKGLPAIHANNVKSTCCVNTKRVFFGTRYPRFVKWESYI